MDISVSFVFKKNIFQNKKKTMLAGCKNEYKLPNHQINTQIA